MSRVEWRYAGAVFTGVIFDAVFFWRFQPYSAREHGPGPLPGYFLPILAFVAALLLTLALESKKLLVPLAMIGGFFAANAGLIVADCAGDPTNHNLWPFEFVIIVIATAPAFLGAGVSVLIDRAQQKKRT